MRQFRFPRSTIVLMLLIFAATVFAIEQGRIISQMYSGPSGLEIDWTNLFRLFAFLAVGLFSIGALGYGLLYALHQSGSQRFPNIRSWAARK